MIIRDTKHFEFEVAHLLPGYDGGCGNLHGHTYKIEVTIEGPQVEPFGFIMDFKDLKKAIDAVVPDHKFICSDYIDPEKDTVEMDIINVLKKYDLQFTIYSFPTTAENMVRHYSIMIEHYIQTELGYKNVEVVESKLWETSTSWSTYVKEKTLTINPINLGNALSSAIQGGINESIRNI